MDSRFSHQLLVLGNGFDITCGLNSRFVQFFRPRMADIDKNKNISKKGWAKTLSASGITAWDLILYFRKELADKGYDVNWSDVELAYCAFGLKVLGFVALSGSAGQKIGNLRAQSDFPTKP